MSGFDHAELDEQQQDWHSHMYPYKLASYQKRALGAPVTLWELDFNAPDGASEAASAAPREITMRLEQGGSCDGVAVWVDYYLGDGLYLSAWDGQDFPAYLTVNIKFFADPVAVHQGSCVQCTTLLDLDKSDFVYDFAVRH